MSDRVVIGILLAIGSLLLILSIVTVSDEALADEGDMNFTGEGSIVDSELKVAKNITVRSMASLRIVNSTVVINSSYPGQFLFKVETGAVLLVVNSTLRLDSFEAEGQASVTFRDNCLVSTKGLFLSRCNALLIYDSTLRNIAPPSDPEHPGRDAVLILDGKVNSECVNVTILNKGSNAGSPYHANGSKGGDSHIISNITRWVNCSIEVVAGVASAGGLGVLGSDGGSGGLGGEAVIELGASRLENTTILMRAGDGGPGSRGSASTEADAGDGGDGGNGGNATLTLDCDTSLELRVVLIELIAGAGGSGGNGGESRNGSAGDGGRGATGGASTLHIYCSRDIVIVDSELVTVGGEGGYGGDYGVLSGDTGNRGIPGLGGDGGDAQVDINSMASGLFKWMTVTARGGPGLDGGGGYDEGEKGGAGANTSVRINAETDLEAYDIEITTYGGHGGNGGPAQSDIWGDGGDGGGAHIEFNGRLEMYVEDFSIYGIVGNGGKGNTPAWDGADGNATLDLETIDLEMWHGVLNLPLDDLRDHAIGHLYNVTFDMIGLIPVLPKEKAEVWTYFPVWVRVVDSPNPSKAKPRVNYTVQVVSVSTVENVTLDIVDEDGWAYFWLPCAHYTADRVEYLGDYYFVVHSPDRRVSKTVRVEVLGPLIDAPPKWHPVIIVIQFTPDRIDLVVEKPLEEHTYRFEKVANSTLEVSGYATTSGSEEITGIYLKLYPAADDPTNWSWIALNRSPHLYSEIVNDVDKWSKFFPPEMNSNRWRFFYHYVIIGDVVEYPTDAYLLSIRAEDGKITGNKTIPFNIAILPDEVPPQVAVKGMEEHTDSIVFNGTASDDWDVELVVARIDDWDWSIVVGTENWTYELYTIGLEEGNHTLQVRSFDGNNYSETVSHPFTLDRGDDGPANGGTDIGDVPWWLVALALAIVIVIVTAMLVLRRRAGS
jgi:hypothetical protein